ncbi:hypothetical protein P872_18385 [Rhodonellum psychrophilum GCM71 = DSM 17998]|uniref:Nuclease-associated modular DNA-binding 1 domain-containing protein n=2 Tax=Rhodonellum TaxID=336827 RepID=U5C0D9_9BACT|nr:MULTISPECIES: NUMOD1 domain-containing DNA-binding protein [Rhodonellum]ERM82366.1 hypothetical protein P872_18385 [Rhodonellum psychrophilum GCM71 = DSM 17998]SDZ35218.1 NUMOD1 domain-containing protein [Rhodonellum ikkaensis]
MTNELYKYVIQISKKIKNKEDIEDVQQIVFLQLCEKDIINNQLDEELKKIILGIVWNCSTKFYNQNKLKNASSVEYIPDNNQIYLSPENEEKLINEGKIEKEILGKLKKFIFENYYKKNKILHYKKFRIWYLSYLGWSYKRINKKVDIKLSIKIVENVSSIIENIIKADFDFDEFKNITKIKIKDIVQLDLNYSFIKKYTNILTASKELNIEYSTIYNCVKKNTDKVGKYIFMEEKEFMQGNFKKKIRKFEVFDKSDNFLGEYIMLNEISKKYNIRKGELSNMIRGKKHYIKKIKIEIVY